MRKLSILTFVILLAACQTNTSLHNEVNTKDPVAGQWSVERINKWYDDQPWLVGCNYYPATAINQIEMWQISTWDPKQIDKELGWAEGIGMNTLRVFLHDLVWGDDEQGLYARMDEFLNICQKHGIRPWFVFFDDCHFPDPNLGVQPTPVKAFHNSGWVNCPARDLAIRYAKGEATAKEVKHLKGYVQKTMVHFKNDRRILMWELYNEPGRGVGLDGHWPSSYSKSDFGDLSKQLVYDSWVWAREVNPSQPITSCTDGSVGKINIQINRINSDLHSIHCYGNSKSLRGAIQNAQKDGRPVIVSEWLARTIGSKVADCLPVMKEMHTGAVNWGFVLGKTETVWSWSSREDTEGKRRNVEKEREQGNVKSGDPYPEPELWFHDLFRMDGTPFDPNEIEVFNKLTGKGKID